MKTKEKCIIVMAFHEYQEIPYDKWFPNLRFIFFADVKNKETFRDCKSQVIYFDNYEETGPFANQIETLAKYYEITDIVARAERDIIRAAALRQLVNAKGLTIDESLIFRNKYSMYKRAAAGGIPLAPFSRIETFEMAHNFFKKHGPSVMKPCYGSGSLGVEFIKSEEDLLKTFMSFGKEEALIQVFSHGTMYHVDGIWNGGEVQNLAASRYINTCVSFRDNQFLGSVIERKDNFPVDFDLCAQRVLSAMKVNKPFIFHLEVFVANGQWSLCEIACRPGGARIMKTIEVGTGVNLEKKYLELVTMESASPSDGNFLSITPSSAGFLVIPPRAGRIKNISYPKTEKWIREIRESRSLFDPSLGAKKSGDYLLTYVVTGNSTLEVEAKISYLGGSISKSITMEGR